jgi:hypothetical protein
MRSVTETIGTTEYEITKPLADAGLEFSLAMSKILLPFAAQLIDAIQAGDLALIAATVGQVTTKLTPADLKYINETLGALTQVHHTDGRSVFLRPAEFNNHFSDRYDEWLTWVVLGVKTVCGSFFVGALGLGALLKKKSQSASKSTAQKNQADTNSQSPKPAETIG